jgi:hypothetical protein
MTRKRRVNRKNSNSGVGTKQEDPEFSALRKNLFAQLSPTTPLQHIAVETVLSCSWRCRLAIRLDAESAAQFVGELPKAEGETNFETDPTVSRWYGESREALRTGIRFLSRCKEDFESFARIRDDWKEHMDRGWGEDLFADLKKWEPANRDALLLADHLVRHQRRFGGSLPNTTEGEPEVMPDPLLQKQMVSKLLTQEIRHLHALALITDQKVGVARGRLNGSVMGFESHYLKSAMHDLQRSVEWLKRLRRHHL